MIKPNQKIILQKFKDIAILKHMIMANRKSELYYMWTIHKWWPEFKYTKGQNKQKAINMVTLKK